MTDWYPPLARAIPALVLAAVVTFSADHSARLGLLAFGAFAVVSGLLLLVLLWRAAPSPARPFQRAQAAFTLVAGIAGLAISGGGVAFLIFLISGWAIVTGGLEAWLGLRRRRHEPGARDWIFAGALTLALAVAVLIVPPGLAQSFTGPDGIERQLTASVVVVGLLGAYAALLGVFLVIGALSLKWARDASTSPSNPHEARP